MHLSKRWDKLAKQWRALAPPPPRLVESDSDSQRSAPSPVPVMFYIKIWFNNSNENSADWKFNIVTSWTYKVAKKRRRFESPLPSEIEITIETKTTGEKNSTKSEPNGHPNGSSHLYEKVDEKPMKPSNDIGRTRQDKIPTKRKHSADRIGSSTSSETKANSMEVQYTGSVQPTIKSSEKTSSEFCYISLFVDHRLWM